MANYERGVYEPRDEARDGRVFDGAEDDDDVEGSRLPLLIVLALLVLAMFGGVVWLAYTQGVARGRGETPVLTAANGPERVAPPQGGGPPAHPEMIDGPPCQLPLSPIRGAASCAYVSERALASHDVDRLASSRTNAS